MEGRYCDVLFDSPQAHPAMLVLAREAAAMTQTELARSMAALADGDVSQGYVSRAESGRLTVTGESRAPWVSALLTRFEITCPNRLTSQRPRSSP